MAARTRCNPAAFLAVLVLLFGLACGGVAPQSGDECCTVDDIVKLTDEGVSDELIIATIRTSGTDLDLSAEDIVRLTDASVSPEVIDVLNGGPCVCEPLAEPEPTDPDDPVGSGKKPEAPKMLKLAVKYNGGKNMEVVNLSKTDYTGITMVVNDEYQYRLKKLKANAGDFIRFKTFVSRRTGADGNKIDMTKIVITADQGSYSRTF